MLFRCGGIKEFIKNPSFHEDAFAYLGLSERQVENLKKQQIKALLKTRFGEMSAIKIKRVLRFSRTRQGRLCFFGPPGTRKSAHAKHLAASLEMPLIAKQASDIIEAYIGETEKNIARMFEQTADEKGVLLLDEADSFLRDRSQSKNSWEVTQVNELLVQMENYHGIFICSTNLMENLDPAVLRRFDFKVSFDYLTGTSMATILPLSC